MTKYVDKSRKKKKQNGVTLSYSSRTRQLKNQRDTIYYADSRSKGKPAPFHWNMGSPRNVESNIATTKVNEENPKKDYYRHKNVELAPLSP